MYIIIIILVILLYLYNYCKLELFTPNLKLPRNNTKKVLNLKNSNPELFYNNYMVVKVINGLCNRLQVIYSFLYYAKRLNKKLIVVWKKDEACPDMYYKFFKKNKNIIFINKDHDFNYTYIGYKNIPKICKNIENINKNEIISNKLLQLCKHQKYKKKIFKSKYRILKLNRYMQNIINKNILQLNINYLAIHVRRTDILHYYNTISKDVNIVQYSEYENFLDKYPDYNIYIATDNLDTQLYFYNKYKDRIKVIQFIKRSDKMRQTSLKDSIIDLYMCINATHFMGSPRSTFTTFINKNRKYIL